jgi:U3 small nucleolar RNA-associated protein 14
VPEDIEKAREFQDSGYRSAKASLTAGLEKVQQYQEKSGVIPAFFMCNRFATTQTKSQFSARS